MYLWTPRDLQKTNKKKRLNLAHNLFNHTSTTWYCFILVCPIHNYLEGLFIGTKHCLGAPVFLMPHQVQPGCLKYLIPIETISGDSSLA